MRNIISFLALLVLMTACGTNGKNANCYDNDGARNQDENKKELLCGGYTDQREITEEEMVMFRKVTEECDMVFTPLSVSTQVVAGTNFKFWCRYGYKEKEKSGHCWVIIYQPLQGDPQLSGIEE